MGRKKGYVILSVLTALAMILSQGCGAKDDKYTYREAGIQAMEAGDYEEAIWSFDTALHSSKGLVRKVDIDILKYRAEAEFLAGNYKEAEKTYGTLIVADGEKPEYFNLRSTVRSMSGNLDGAFDDYKKGREIDKEWKASGRLNALFSLGDLMRENGAFEEAMSLYEEALSKGENSAMLYNQLGALSMEKEDYDSAIQYFDQGFSSEDGSHVPELLFNKAVAMEYKGEFKEALQLMERYVSAYGPDEAAEREIKFLKTR